MHTQHFDLDVIIVTRERQVKLVRCVESLLQSNCSFNQLIIIQSIPAQKSYYKKEIKTMCLQHHVSLIFKHVVDKGISYSRNVGIDHNRSRYFCFIDDDEVAPPDWIGKAKNLLVEHPEFDVISGPKLPYYLGENYWNDVWFELLKSSFSRFGQTTFISSSNSFYKAALIKRHAIRFNELIRGSSEDRFFSTYLNEHNVLLYFAGDLIVYHDFRLTFQSFAHQWFEYGQSMFFFKKETEFARDQLKTLLSLRHFFSDFSIPIFSLRLLPGLFVLLGAYFAGFFNSFLSGDKGMPRLAD